MTFEQFLAQLQDATARRLGEAISVATPQQLQTKLSGTNMTMGDFRDCIRSGTDMGNVMLTEFLGAKLALFLFEMFVEETP